MCPYRHREEVSVLEGVWGSVPRLGRFTPGKGPIHVVEEGGLAPKKKSPHP